MKAKTQQKIKAAIANKKVQAVRPVNAIAEALPTLGGLEREDTHSITENDFKPVKEPVEQEESIITVAPGEAERLRQLKLIQGTNGVDRGENRPDIITTIKEGMQLRQLTQDEINGRIIVIKDQLAEQQTNEFPRMTIEAYKTLKEHYRFWEMLHKHDVLYGLNGRELDILGNVMHSVFEPSYNFDWWCSSCIAEFIKTLYTHFDNWQAKQSEEVLAQYDTVVKEDKF